MAWLPGLYVPGEGANTGAVGQFYVIRTTGATREDTRGEEITMREIREIFPYDPAAFIPFGFPEADQVYDLPASLGGMEAWAGVVTARVSVALDGTMELTATE